MSNSGIPSLIIPLAALPLLLAASACSTLSYYSQAIDGQMEITKRQEKNTLLLADPHTPAALQRQLALIAELRTFAETQLELPAGNNYTAYADLQRPHVVWSVFAAPEFSLEPKKWWYPVVGKLSYRGYFDEADARQEGKMLETQGFDVFIGDVNAYSTLGWFNDPVLNTFVNDPDSELAELIFHELTHRKIYLSGDTDFNEALATAVAEEGVRRWLRSKNRLRDLTTYERDLQRRRAVFALIDQSRIQLESLYARTNLSDSEMRQQKATCLETLVHLHQRLLASWNGDKTLDRDPIAEVHVNNAFLNAVDTYHRLVPQFEALLAQHDGNLATFFPDVKRRRKEFTTAD